MYPVDETASPLREVPSDADRRDFRADELFFSITDARGVILHANEVFVRISGHSFEALRGAPHNIIRDPAMPRGAFRLAWEMLESGRTVASYVANRAEDGKRYEVFAVMTPIRDGYLSIRLKPEVPEWRDTVFAIYDEARALEAESGGSARDQATEGARAILAALGERGIADMAALTRRTLPREVAAMIDASSATRAADGTGPLLEVLNGTHEIAGMMRQVLAELDRLDVITASLRTQVEASGPQAEQLRELKASLVEATELAIGHAGAPAVTGAVEGDAKQFTSDDPATLAHDVAERIDAALTELAGLPARLRDTEEKAEALSERIAVFALQNAMIGRFAAELVDGRAVEPPGQAMRLLYDTLNAGSGALVEDVFGIGDWAKTAPEDITQAVAGVDRSRRRVQRWHTAIVRAVEGRDLHEAKLVIRMADQVSQRSVDGFGWLGDLATLAARINLVTVRIDVTALAAALERVGNATRDID